MLVLVGWTLLVMLLIPYRRFQAGFAGQVKYGDFRYGESANVPGKVSIPNRNYMNLLEAPLLFYVTCIVLFLMNHVTTLVLALAWAYVAARIVHSLIHLSYNNVVHRLMAFGAGKILLAILWIIAIAAAFAQ